MEAEEVTSPPSKRRSSGEFGAEEDKVSFKLSGLILLLREQVWVVGRGLKGGDTGQSVKRQQGW